MRDRSLLRIAGLYTYPSQKIKYFSTRIIQHKPAIGLEKIKNNVQLVSTVKFYFKDGSTGYCDGRFSTLWDGHCHINHFFSTLRYAKLRLAQMLYDKIFILHYTKSFDYLSPLVFKFINGLKKGIKKVEFLAPKGGVIEQSECDLIAPSFLIGYYPKILTEGFVFLEKEGKFKKLAGLEDEVLYASMLARFSQPNTESGVILNTILIKRKKHSLPSWAILSDKKEGLKKLLKKYLNLWPPLEKVFLEDIKVIEQSFLSQEKEKDLNKFVPQTLFLERREDFGKIGDILASIFQEEVGALEFTGKSGEFIVGKDSCRVLIRNIAPSIKRTFNSKCLYFSKNKRAYLV